MNSFKLNNFSSATAFTAIMEREEAIAEETIFLRDLMNDMEYLNRVIYDVRIIIILICLMFVFVIGFGNV